MEILNILNIIQRSEGGSGRGWGANFMRGQISGEVGKVSGKLSQLTSKKMLFGFKHIPLTLDL